MGKQCFNIFSSIKTALGEMEQNYSQLWSCISYNWLFLWDYTCHRWAYNML